MNFKNLRIFAHYFTCARYYFFAKKNIFLSFLSHFFRFTPLPQSSVRVFFGNSQRKCYLCGHNVANGVCRRSARPTGGKSEHRRASCFLTERCSQGRGRV